jgi:thiamine-monophosphate kinase
MDEGQLVERIARALSIRPASPVRAQKGRRRLAASLRSGAGTARSSVLRLAIGDDAAILAPARQTDWVFTCDAFLENVHFLMKAHPPNSVGYKSLVRAMSDVVAMGAVPRYFLLTLALSAKAMRPQWLNSFLRGMALASRELGVSIIGGDTTKSDRVVISITAIGEVAPRRELLRSGAGPGDLIFVSGKLGRAQLGLAMVLRGYAKDPRFRAIVEPHLYPKIRPELSAWLARHRVASAMMDISDGLSTDLARLCTASRTGAEIWADKLPLTPVPKEIVRQLGKRGRNIDPLQLALHGGDDYELLFTVPQGQVHNLRAAPGSSTLSPVGRITAQRKVILITTDGRRQPLTARGWDPFKKK